jgi:hypothetical protein
VERRDVVDLASVDERCVRVRAQVLGRRVPEPRRGLDHRELDELRGDAERVASLNVVD